MDQQVLIVCVVGGFLGVLSGILGFSAEATKITASDIYVYGYACVYPSSSPAFGLAIGASLVLVVAQIIITAFGGCCGCCRRNPPVSAVTNNNPTLVIIFAVISWIMFAVSLILLILGAIRNGTGGQTTSLYNCYVVKPGIFAGGAICALIAIFLSIVAYISSSHPTNSASTLHSEIPIVPPPKPQYPPPGTPYPPPGIDGTPYLPPGVDGTLFPPPGVDGSQYPPPGVDGTPYISSIIVPKNSN